MKKILKALALIVCLLLPLSAMAMSTIADNELSSVTGQAGVSINMDVSMDIYAGVVSWGDKDGVTSVDGVATANIGFPGWVGLTDLTATDVRIRLRQDRLVADWNSNSSAGNFATLTTDVTNLVGEALAYYNVPALGSGHSNPAGATPTATMTALLIRCATHTETLADINLLAGDALGHSYDGGGVVTAIQTLEGSMYDPQVVPLTIDVATDSSTGHGVANTTFVRIGLGSIEVSMASLSTKVKIGQENTLSAYGTGTLGSIYLDNLDVLVNGASYVDIYNGRASGQGVTLGFNVTVDKITVGALSWGDSDGISGSATNANQGWIGLKGMTINTLTINGPVAIDVVNDSGRTYVDVGFGTGLTVGMTDMSATVALGTAGTNAALTQELGGLYVKGLNMKITGDVQIGAHSDSTNGVVIYLNGLNIDIPNAMTVSWGDDGAYVGLKNLKLAGLNINGQISIDVASVSGAAPDNQTAFMYSSYQLQGMGSSFVHIVLGDGTLAVGNTMITSHGTNGIGGSFASGALGIKLTSLDTDIALGNTQGFTSGSATMGSLHVGGLMVGVNGWVDIGTH